MTRTHLAELDRAARTMPNVTLRQLGVGSVSYTPARVRRIARETLPDTTDLIDQYDGRNKHFSVSYLTETARTLGVEFPVSGDDLAIITHEPKGR